MPEIKTPIRKLREGRKHIAGPDEYLITEHHSFADIFRWLVRQAGGKDALKSELDSFLAN